MLKIDVELNPMQAQHLRHQYLEVLGVTSWLSRTQLPGAAASPDWVSGFVYSEEALSQGLNAEGDEPVSNDGSKAHVKSLAASLVTGNADVEEISRDAQLIAQDVVTHLPVTQRENRPIAPQASPIAAAPPIPAPLVEPKLKQAEAAVVATHVMPNARSQKSAPQMRLMFWQYPDVLVVDSLPTQTRGTLASAQYEKLLNNMILAMRLNPARVDAGAQPYTLNWPTLAGASIDQGWDQAVSAVQYKLSKILQGYSPKLVLMLGESSAQMLMNVEDDFDAMRGIVFSLRADTKALTSYSLTQMLNVPGCKRDVWQDLQKVMDK